MTERESLTMIMIKTDIPRKFENDGKFQKYGGEAVPLEKAVRAKNMALGKMKTVLSTISFLVFLGALIGVITITRSGSSERVREIGIFKAMGMKTRKILNLFMFEHLIYGVSSASLAILLGLGNAYLLSKFSTPFTVGLTVGGVLYALGASALALLLAAGLYVLKTYRTDPAIELKGE